MAGQIRDYGSQIKTRDRVRDLAEVYTHGREIASMLDLTVEMFPSTAAGGDIKFLEPACGSGNFLVEILERKLSVVRFARIRSASNYEHRILRVLASIYGVDICAENVDESRDRMLAVVRSHYYRDANTIEPTEGFVAAVRVILSTNILRADFLAEATNTEVIDYQPLSGGCFRRVWSMLDDSDSTNYEPDLFNQVPEPKRDQIPVHYFDLAAIPEPTRLGSSRFARPSA